MGQADAYYDWMLAEVRPWLGRRVLEVGSGRGTLTRRLLGLPLDWFVASDYDPDFLGPLRELCRRHQNAGVLHLDLETRSAVSADAVRAAGIDTVIMINVLEHIADDAACLGFLRDALPPGGRIIVFAPAFQSLYAPLDKLYGHYRRYGRSDVAALARQAGLELEERHYVNAPGFFAWALLYKVLGGRGLGSASVSAFNTLLPAIRWVESRVRPPFGLSITAVFRKPVSSTST
jgi:SAM-dependent methyltransferase